MCECNVKVLPNLYKHVTHTHNPNDPRQRNNTNTNINVSIHHVLKTTDISSPHRSYSGLHSHHSPRAVQPTVIAPKHTHTTQHFSQSAMKRLTRDPIRRCWQVCRQIQQNIINGVHLYTFSLFLLCSLLRRRFSIVHRKHRCQGGRLLLIIRRV